MNHEHASFSFKMKGGVDDAGRFSGLLASFGTIDLGGVKILPGAFTKTIAGNRSFPLLWQHDPAQPIGSFTAKEISTGLWVEGQLLLSIQQAKDARELLKAGVLKGLSIGYDTITSDYVGDVRELSELKLWEGSIVTFAMSPESMVTGIKSLSDADKAVHYKAIDTHRKAASRHLRQMNEHMKALFSDVTDDEPLDDPAVLEDDVEGKAAFLSELKSLAEFASDWANA